MAASSRGAPVSFCVTRFMLQAGSISLQLALGGNCRRCSASTVMSASMAPAAPEPALNRP